MLSTGNTALWGVLFFLSVLATAGLGVYHSIAKSQRWESTALDQDQLEVETLAGLGQQHRERPKDSDKTI